MSRRSGKKAAKSQNKLSKAVKDAGSSAMKNLQGFDEINQLQSEIADSAVPSADDFRHSCSTGRGRTGQD